MGLMRAMACGLFVLAGLMGAVACSSGAGAAGEDFQQVDLSQLPPAEQMIRAAAIGDVDTLKDLVGREPRLMLVRGPNGNTPLHAAAVNGKDDAVEFLLEAGANPTIPNDDGHTAGALAAQYDHVETAKLIAATVGAGGAGGAGQ